MTSRPCAPSCSNARGAAAGRILGRAQFEVAEYEIVILSATESTGLDDGLRENDYNIPAGAEPLLRPYVEQDMKFFVAKVDPSKVTFGGNESPIIPMLRFQPTSISPEDAKDKFGEFYVALFDHTLAQNPGAVVTEYTRARRRCADLVEGWRFPKPSVSSC